MKKYFLISSLIILLFSACSTKKVFEPKNTTNDWEKYKPLEGNIIDTSLNVALLDNSKVLTTSGVVNVHIGEAYRVISKSESWIISATVGGKLSLKSLDKKKEIIFELKKTIASASVQGDTLAVLFADNEIALYTISTKKVFLKEQGSEALAVNARIENPYFVDDLVFFPTLDGKVVIVNAKLKKKLRTVIVSAEDNFNNIIYFDMLDNKIIAATGYGILSLASKEIRGKYEIRNVVHDEKNIYIATKQGEVISLTSNLQLNGKLKFPFAHFLGMISYKNKLYLLEKEGYMIVVDKDMKKFTIHEVSIDDDGYVLVAGKVFSVDDEQILVK